MPHRIARMNYLKLVILLAAATLAAGQNKTSKISGGSEVSILSYPYAVFLTTEIMYCAATIISPTWVITTGDCLADASQINVRAGSSSRLTGGSVHTGYVTFLHPQYVPGSFDYNYAVIMVWPPFPLDALGYSKVRLPWYDPLPGQIASASGWGSTAWGGILSTNLRAVTMAVAMTKICQSYYPDVTISPRIMCAGTTGGNTCVGDGGAPLVNQNTGELYGMGLFSKYCSTGGAPSGFVNVANQRYWIYSVTGV